MKKKLSKKVKPVAVISEPLRGTYNASREQADAREKIVRRAIETALKQGWFPDFVAFDTHSLFVKGIDSAIYYRDKDGLRVHFLNGFFNDVIFNRGFAKALGYSIVELAVCCADGEDPFAFLEQFLE